MEGRKDRKEGKMSEGRTDGQKEGRQAGRNSNKSRTDFQRIISSVPYFFFF